MNEVRWITVKRIGDRMYAEGSSDSSVDKPKTIQEGTKFWPIAEGSLLVHSDNGNVYMFNETDNDWVLQFCLQS